MTTFSALALSAALAAPTLTGAHIGALVVDGATGSVVYSQDSTGSFQPASTLKLFVGLAALSQLGPDYSFETDLLTDGAITGGTLNGLLYLRGGGDPTLDPAALTDAARTLRAQSIAQIDGDIVADSSHFSGSSYPPGWVIDDLAQDYAAPVSGLSYNDNAVALSLEPGNAVGAAPTLTENPNAPEMMVANDATTGAAHSPDSTALARTLDDAHTIRIVGSLPIDGGTTELDAAAPIPPLFAADALRNAIIERGITARSLREGITPPQARLLWSHRSAPLSELLARMWLPSDNLLAESLLDELGTRSPGPGDSRDRGIARETAWMQGVGIDPATLSVADGSGLSQYDRVTPAALVTALRSAWAGADRAMILAALPLAGVRGTLKDSFTGTPLEGAVIAKTGSMSHVRALAGYIVRPGRTLIFALLINDWMDRTPGASAAIRLTEQRFLEAAQTHP